MNLHKIIIDVVINIGEGYREEQKEPAKDHPQLFVLVLITLNLYNLLASHSRHSLFTQIFMATYVI